MSKDLGAPSGEHRCSTHACMYTLMEAWPLALGKAALRFLEARAFSFTDGVRGTILDIGCGDGVFARTVAGGRGYVVGVDLNSQRLQRACERGLSGVLADAHKLPFADAAFDTVISNSTLEHLDGPGSVVAEAERVLRPGGRLLFTVPVEAKLRNLLFNSVEAAGYASYFNEYWRHVTMVSPQDWHRIVLAHAPSLHLASRCSFETRSQSQIIDLLASIRASSDTFVASKPELRQLQTRRLAELVLGLLCEAEVCEAGEEYSEWLFEYVKRPEPGES